MGKSLGIDLGTAYTRFCLGKQGIVLRAPSVISLESKTNRVLAVGAEAKQMIGRTPANISAVKPVRGGVVTNVDHAALLIGTILEKANMTSAFRRPTVLSAIPFGASDSERRAIEDAIFDAGASTVLLTEAPVAAAIGAGLKVLNPRGCMLVDIGAGTVEVVVISNGGVVISSSLKLAGEAMTEAIVRNVMDNHSVLIGEATAESLKINLGTISPVDRGSAEICGKSTKMGGAAKAIVTSGELREALIPYANHIVATIRGALERTPATLSADISETGILICGGGSLLPGLTEYVKNAIGMNVTRAKDPLDCTCNGINHILMGGHAARRFICSRSH